MCDDKITILNLTKEKKYSFWDILEFVDAWNRNQHMDGWILMKKLHQQQKNYTKKICCVRQILLPRGSALLAKQTDLQPPPTQKGLKFVSIVSGNTKPVCKWHRQLFFNAATNRLAISRLWERIWNGELFLMSDRTGAVIRVRINAALSRKLSLPAAHRAPSRYRAHARTYAHTSLCSRLHTRNTRDRAHINCDPQGQEFHKRHVNNRTLQTQGVS